MSRPRPDLKLLVAACVWQSGGSDHRLRAALDAAAPGQGPLLDALIEAVSAVLTRNTPENRARLDAAIAEMSEARSFFRPQRAAGRVRSGPRKGRAA